MRALFGAAVLVIISSARRPRRTRGTRVGTGHEWLMWICWLFYETTSPTTLDRSLRVLSMVLEWIWRAEWILWISLTPEDFQVQREAIWSLITTTWRLYGNNDYDPQGQFPTAAKNDKAIGVAPSRHIITWHLVAKRNILAAVDSTIICTHLYAKNLRLQNLSKSALGEV